MKVYKTLSGFYKIKENHTCVDIYKEVHRLIKLLWLFIFTITFTHYFITESPALSLPILIITNLISFIFIFIAANSNRKTIQFPNINIVLLVFLFSAIGKLASRLNYVQALVASNGNTYLARSSDLLVGGGWYSYLAIFFYPACIIIFFLSIKYKISKYIYILIFSFLAFDIFLVGMRATPVFIILFAYIFTQYRKKTKNILINGTYILLITILAFGFTTKLKSWNGTDMNLSLHLVDTISTQVSKIKPIVLTEFSDNDFILSYVYFSHYLYHSNAELANYLESSSINENSINLTNIREEFCMFGLCENLSEEREYNIGTYKTFYFTLLYDIGTYNTIIILILIAIPLFFFLKKRITGVLHYYALMVILLSPIENFITSGMGLLQALAMFSIIILSRLRISKH